MRDALGPGTILGYCTNVHAGATLRQTLTGLERYAAEVKRRVSPDAPMGVGLWLSEAVLHELSHLPSASSRPLIGALARHGLMPYTLNGFPQGNFHAGIVKHAVYEPAWDRRSRARYTMALVAVLKELVGEAARGAHGSISTLPVGWPGPPAQPVDTARAAAELRLLTEFLFTTFDRRGFMVHVDLEPEPGCILGTADDVIGFYRLLRRDGWSGRLVGSHLRVCLDICHCAVMFEDPVEAIRRYEAAGIGIGKVQVSSAVRVDFEALSSADRREALRQLAGFQEPRYLHQTVVLHEGQKRFYEDLPLAIAAVGDAEPRGEWRVHFHVPIFVERFGLIETTQAQIAPAVEAARAAGTRHFEVETYAWNVLPEPLREPDLAAGIARELDWLRGRVPPVPPATAPAAGGAGGAP